MFISVPKRKKVRMVLTEENIENIERRTSEKWNASACDDVIDENIETLRCVADTLLRVESGNPRRAQALRERHATRTPLYRVRE